MGPGSVSAIVRKFDVDSPDACRFAVGATRFILALSFPCRAVQVTIQSLSGLLFLATMGQIMGDVMADTLVSPPISPIASLGGLN